MRVTICPVRFAEVDKAVKETCRILKCSPQEIPVRLMNLITQVENLKGELCRRSTASQ